MAGAALTNVSVDEALSTAVLTKAELKSAAEAPMEKAESLGKVLIGKATLVDEALDSAVVLSNDVTEDEAGLGNNALVEGAIVGIEPSICNVVPVENVSLGEAISMEKLSGDTALTEKISADEELDHSAVKTSIDFVFIDKVTVAESLVAEAPETIVSELLEAFVIESPGITAGEATK